VHRGYSGALFYMLALLCCVVSRLLCVVSRLLCVVSRLLCVVSRLLCVVLKADAQFNAKGLCMRGLGSRQQVAYNYDMR
jgi:hypothetical protein